jgi:hypothetical protein
MDTNNLQKHFSVLDENKMSFYPSLVYREALLLVPFNRGSSLCENLW